ncbi:MAG: DinB family protein [Acidobacteriota bacterium]|nr:DinB family protein [Acidobacteriota bacterium]
MRGHPHTLLHSTLCGYRHTVHHRGQLSAYLRAAGSKVPSIYGPSADTAITAATT